MSWLDLKLGIRMLVRYPGLTVVAVFALSLAIGGGAAYLEIINDIFYPRLQFTDGDRIVGIYNEGAAGGDVEPRLLREFVEARQQLQSVDDLGAFVQMEANLITDDGRAEPVRGVEVSASVFRVFPTPPLLGRPLVDDDEKPGAAPVVVLGHDLWETRFGSNPAIIGRTVRVGAEPRTIVGIMPRGFSFPAVHTLWVPLQIDASTAVPAQPAGMRMFGRLTPGADYASAQAELTALAQRAAADSGQTREPLRPVIEPFVEAMWSAGEDSDAQGLILYAINIVFLGLLGICGANVATLVFARIATREGEITLRNALGASRSRIVGQLFAEGLVLTTTAAVVGLAIAAFAAQWAKNTVVAAQGMAPFWWNDGLSPETLIYTCVLAVFVAVIVGVVPALKATGAAVQERLKQSGAGASGLKFGGMWTGVIVSQVAFTVLFLLIVGSVMWNVRIGRYGAPAVSFPTSSYLSVRLEMDRSDSPDAAQQTRRKAQTTYRELERRLAAEPGVAAITYASALPGMIPPRLNLEVDAPVAGQPIAPEDGVHYVRTAAVAAEFFEAFNIPVVLGRSFDARDIEFERDVAIVDQSFVRFILGGGDPIGQRVRRAAAEDDEPGPWLEIVGVIKDITVLDGKTAQETVVYRPAAAGAVAPLHVAVHASDAAALAPRLRAIAAEVDPTLRIYDVMPLNEVNRGSDIGVAFVGQLLTVVSVIALLLSTVGVYSLMAFTVARRTREIGIRVALGADRRQIVFGTLSRALWQVALGIVAGSIPGSMLVTWGAPEIAEGAGASMGAAALVIVALFMIGVCALASAVPTRRALTIEPTEALRADA